MNRSRPFWAETCAEAYEFNIATPTFLTSPFVSFCALHSLDARIVEPLVVAWYEVFLFQGLQCFDGAHRPVAWNNRNNYTFGRRHNLGFGRLFVLPIDTAAGPDEDCDPLSEGPKGSAVDHGACPMQMTRPWGH